MSVLNSRKTAWLAKPSRLFTVVTAISGILILCTILMQEPVLLRKGTKYFEILELIAIIIYIYVMIIYILELIKTEKQRKRINALEDYNKTLKKVNDNICGFKHDFSNFVQALDGYVETNNMAGVKTMSHSILKDCSYTKNLEALNLNVIKNEAVYSIISNKYFLARSKNIDINIEIVTDLNDVQRYSYEICKILAILLDNAIEAVSECNHGFINLRILKDNKANRKIIVVENTYTNKDIDIDKLFEKGVTSKTNAKGHGLGLWNVRKILRRRNNLNLYTTKGELFSQQLEIYLNSPK